MPVRKLEVFSYEFELENGFRSASGTVFKKETFFFLRPDRDRKIIELPLSPSMGFKTDEFKSLIQTHPEMLRRHRLIQNLITWFDANPSELSSPKSPKICDFKTLGIGEPIPDSFSGILKLKADLNTYHDIAKLSQGLSNRNQLWSVDFNRSLNQEALTDFIKSSNLSSCFCVEQPLPLGEVNKKICEIAPIYLDEEMEIFSEEKWRQLTPAGFVLKPFRHSWQDYQKWHEFAAANQISYFVGSMIQSEIADNLCCQLNSKATIQYSCRTQQNAQTALLEKSRFLGTI